ncbi:MAG: ribonuclease III [Bacteroidota bacterium]
MSFSIRRALHLIHRPTDEEDKRLYKAIRAITGRRPYNLQLYKLAMRHSSIASINARGLRESNERLEYLGDAILGMIVAEFLFMRYPFKEEGFLTEVRSKIVNRERLNELSRKIGLKNLIQFHQPKSSLSPKSIYGDSLEALIGAIYLDKGFKFCRRFIIKKLIIPHFDLEELVNTITNHKSRIIEWSQKSNRKLSFEIVDESQKNKHGQFIAQVFIDGEAFEKGYGFSKKKAEQDAARKTIEKLEEIKLL